MMNNISRLAIAVILGAVLATLLALQAASGMSERKAPQLAVALNPLNGMAREQLAYAQFGANSTDIDSMAEAASNARPIALASYQSEPLVPKALSILALATPNAEQRSKLLELANRLNRRDLALQIAVLQDHLSKADAIASIATLDQLLRVHPDVSDQFFPPLQQALLNPSTQATFAKLLDGSSPWHDAFAMAAVRDEAARVQLARIRPEIKVTDELFDRMLISGLAAQGEMQLAANLYKTITKPNDTVKDGVSRLSWRGEFPPFDWEYLDRTDIRAKTSQDDERLDVFVRPGEGGIIAKRIVPLPANANGQIALKVESSRPLVAGRMRMMVYCGNAPTATAQIDLAKGDNDLTFAQDGDDCDAIRIEIHARAYRREPVLRARLSQIQIG